jgi:alanyl-tRNA synthetase
MSRDDAEALGAMALFGEKYGDWVRVIEVDDVSRELCGGTHVANTAEIGIVAIVSEGSSAANVRRIEALSGPAAIDHYRRRSDELDEVGALLRSPRDPVNAARRAAEDRAEMERLKARESREQAGEKAAEISAAGESIGGIWVIASPAQGDQHRLLDLADQIKQSKGDAAVVLGAKSDGKVALVASFSPSAVERGANAVDVIREAAAVVGGGGGGRAEVAQAGGRDPERLEEALETARAAIARALS